MTLIKCQKTPSFVFCSQENHHALVWFRFCLEFVRHQKKKMWKREFRNFWQSFYQINSRSAWSRIYSLMIITSPPSDVRHVLLVLTRKNNEFLTPFWLTKDEDKRLWFHRGKTDSKFSKFQVIYVTGNLSQMSFLLGFLKCLKKYMPQKMTF